MIGKMLLLQRETVIWMRCNQVMDLKLRILSKKEQRKYSKSVHLMAAKVTLLTAAQQVLIGNQPGKTVSVVSLSLFNL